MVQHAAFRRRGRFKRLLISVNNPELRERVAAVRFKRLQYKSGAKKEKELFSRGRVHVLGEEAGWRAGG